MRKQRIPACRPTLQLARADAERLATAHATRIGARLVGLELSGDESPIAAPDGLPDRIWIFIACYELEHEAVKNLFSAVASVARHLAIEGAHDPAYAGDAPLPALAERLHHQAVEVTRAVASGRAEQVRASLADVAAAVDRMRAAIDEPGDVSGAGTTVWLSVRREKNSWRAHGVLPGRSVTIVGAETEKLAIQGGLTALLEIV